MFKIGDRVQVLSKSVYPETFNAFKQVHPEMIITVTGKDVYLREPIFFTDNGKFGFRERDLELVSNITNNNTNNMTLKEQFLLAFKSEPQKSFRQKGITNGDDMLTSEGQAILLSWLLNKFGAEFKTEVVDKIEIK